MKKKLLSALIVLSLLPALPTPAGAWEYPPRKYRTLQEYLDFYRTQEDEDAKAFVEYSDWWLTEGLLEYFDPDAYFEKNHASPGMGVTKENWIYWSSDCKDDKGIYDEEWFQTEMLVDYLSKESRAWKEYEQTQAFIKQYSEEYAAFDPEAWFAGYYELLSLTPEAYMEREGLVTEGFKQAMFLEWLNKDRNFFNGYCVTVDGIPIRFQFYRDLDGEVVSPRAENGRILIPLRAAAEALGLTVEWIAETNQVVCSNETTTVTFTLGSAQYSGGVLDAAPFADSGVTYLPLRALGEALGCAVTWYPDFATAALTTPK